MALRDDGFSLVTAEDYVLFRLEPIIVRNARRAPFLSCLLTALQLGAFITTALTTVLAIVGQAIFVPGALTVTSQLNAIADFEQLATRVRNLNLARMELER